MHAFIGMRVDYVDVGFHAPLFKIDWMALARSLSNIDCPLRIESTRIHNAKHMSDGYISL